MPTWCSVRPCSSAKSGHRFPRDKSKLEQWLKAIRRENFTPSKDAMVCKNHFTSEDYTLPKDPTYPNSSLRLKKDAVPSVFSWNAAEKENRTHKENEGENNKETYTSQEPETQFGKEIGCVKVETETFTMSEIANSEGASETEKPEPVQTKSDITFPPFPEPTDADFEDDISQEERDYYKNKFKDLNAIKALRLHCTACDRHLGCSTRNENRMRIHPMLRTLVCHTCHTFYNSGEFDKGDDGSELYCRWCGQGGQVYCCSDCPHVFCAKCIKRNLGAPKIKEIENADDWKCFKCNPRCLWDVRAICWAVLRYCDLRNKVAYHTEDPELRDAYQKDCAIDYTECCKSKSNRRQKVDSAKKKEPKKESEAKIAASIISKMPSTIQVKKFASINLDDSVKSEKKAHKRSASPKHGFFIKNPIAISPGPPRIVSPANAPPLVKKMRMPITPLIPIRPQERKPVVTYPRIRPRPTILNTGFNGLHNVAGVFNNVVSDNINLSLENLTQGLDMSAVAAMTTSQDDDVVCTPDFPLEPMCEVTEDNDDDVQCITPAPIATPKISNPPPLVSTTAPKTVPPDISSDNIIQMTENDVTVNAATGGLKFRVDPQTLSSNKMYRLPDGRIFAINANPNMPGGYSATIVAVAETAGKQIPKGATYAAKLSAVSTSTPTSKPTRTVGGRILNSNTKPTVSKPSKVKKMAGARECDLNVPVEWYRYNLIDAVDALEYALSRLQKLKKEATTMYLRSRTVDEMKSLHRTLERLLNTSAYRFNEIRDNINKEIKQYVVKKINDNNSEDDDDDDDDVEILPDLDDADDPIFIDENSVESNMNSNENQEVDLTGAGSSEHNDSAENKIDNLYKNDEDPLLTCNENIDNDNEPIQTTDGNQSPNRNDYSPENGINEDVTLTKHESDSPQIGDRNISKSEETRSNDEDNALKNEDTCTFKNNDDPLKNQDNQTPKTNDNDSQKNVEGETLEHSEFTTEKSNEPGAFIACTLKCKSVEDINGDIIEVKNKCSKNNGDDVDMEDKNLDDKADSQVDCDEKNRDSEMSEEMIENLLKDTLDENATNSNNLDIPDELHDA